MTDISGAMEAARVAMKDTIDLLEWMDRTGGLGYEKHERIRSEIANLMAARALLSHPQRDGEGNRGSEPQVPAPFASSAETAMVDRVARAISPHFFDAKDWADGTPIEREALEKMRARDIERARAAIEAMLNSEVEWATHEGTLETGPLPINASPPIDPWQPISTAPKDGKVIVGMFTCSLKFKLYAKESAEYKRGIAGRWQIPRGEHGGWQNLHDWIPVAWSRAGANQQSKTEEKS